MSEAGRGRVTFVFVLACTLLSPSRKVWVWTLEGWNERLKRLCGELCEWRVEVGLEGGELVELVFEASLGDLERRERKDVLRERKGGI
jgi:hypothetical protein